MELLRRVKFNCCCTGGPVFTLTTWDVNRMVGNKWIIRYLLTMRKDDKIVRLFEGEDFACSPCHAIDSDECVHAIMDFLTLRPGDTDKEYFENYTPEQLAYCDQHAEDLAVEVMARFGED